MANNHIRNDALEMLRDLRAITIRKEHLPDRKALHPNEKFFEKLIQDTLKGKNTVDPWKGIL